MRYSLGLIVLTTLLTGAAPAEEQLRVAVFQADVTPPLGSALCNGNVKPAKEIVTPLTARGIVLLGAGQPIVLCAVDWVGIGNESHDRVRDLLARAVGTVVERVAVHTLHQHDAPGSDFSAERLLAEQGLANQFSHPEFDRVAFERIATAARTSLKQAAHVTHYGLGKAEVEKVASNRRILGVDGKVKIQRQSRSRNPEAQAAPEGTIDPLVRLVSFWNQDTPVVALTYYATHPQSYYGQGFVNWDFVGMARGQREASLPNVPHVHFNGAGGNVAAGKYNDGSSETRPVLAGRLADGMRRAWEGQQKLPLRAADVAWNVQRVALPVRDTLQQSQLAARLQDPKAAKRARLRAARDLTFVRRTEAGHRIELSRLALGDASILHMPGELFVEYQLAAQAFKPEEFVAMAAYGDYGPGYIGTEVAYTQGGYETGPVSRVAPPVEQVLLKGLRALLQPQTLSEDVFLLPYFLGNGETGVYFAYSRDGLTFEWLNDGKVVMPAPPWGDESLTRDPSIVYREGEFHMVWTTSWNSRTIGYASSPDLKTWSKPKQIQIWREVTAVKNSWAPELHWDPEQQEFLILWSSTTFEELQDQDGSEDPHGYDHRTWASRTRDFDQFSKPELFFSPQDPEYSVIDPYIAHDDRGTASKADDRWVMVIKHELSAEAGGKNLRLTFSKRMQGPFDSTLGPPIVGAGTSIVDTMGEGPSLFRRNGLWHLYWDAPGSSFSYCLATSPDLKEWTNRSAEMRLPTKQMRHGTVLVVPESAVKAALP